VRASSNKRVQSGVIPQIVASVTFDRYRFFCDYYFIHYLPTVDNLKKPLALPELSTKLNTTEKKLTISNKIRKYYNIETWSLLYKVGSSQEPISSTELSVSSKYNYTRIKDLHPIPVEKKFLFNWDIKYLNDNKKEVVSKLNSIFNLKWNLDDATKIGYYYNNDDKIKYSLNQDKTELFIDNEESTKSVKINLECKNKDIIIGFLRIVNKNRNNNNSSSNIEIKQEEKEKKSNPLLVKKRRDNKIQIFIEMVNFDYLIHKSFFRISLKENKKQEIKFLRNCFDNKDKLKQLSQETKVEVNKLKNIIRENIDSIQNDNMNFRYMLNLRGLLLYLYLEFNLPRQDKRRIEKVLLNPKTQEIAPFLSNWKSLEKEGINVIRILSEIANEFINQLEIDDVYSIINQKDKSNNDYLLLRITEKFFYRVYLFFETVHFGIPKSRRLNSIDFKNLQLYYLKILEYLVERYNEYQKSIQVLKDKHNRQLNKYY
jgi:hypothetical protein